MKIAIRLIFVILVCLTGVLISIFVFHSDIKNGSKISTIMLIGYFSYPINEFIYKKLKV